MRLRLLIQSFINQIIFLVCLSGSVYSLTPVGQNPLGCSLAIGSAVPLQFCGNSVDEETVLYCKNLPVGADIKAIFQGSNRADNYLANARRQGGKYYVRLFNLLAAPGVNEIVFQFGINNQIHEVKFRIAIDTFGPMAQLRLVNSQTRLHVVDAFSPISRVDILDLALDIKDEIYSKSRGVNSAWSELISHSPRDLTFGLKDLSNGQYLIRTMDNLGNSFFYKLAAGRLQLMDSGDFHVDPFAKVTAPSSSRTTTLRTGFGNPDANGIGLAIVINTGDFDLTSDLEPVRGKILSIRSIAHDAIDNLDLALAEHGLQVPGFAQSTKSNLAFYIRNIIDGQTHYLKIVDGPIINAENKIFIRSTEEEHMIPEGSLFKMDFGDLMLGERWPRMANFVLNSAYESGQFQNWSKHRNRVIWAYDLVYSIRTQLGGVAPFGTNSVMVSTSPTAGPRSHLVGTFIHEIFHTFGMTHAGHAVDSYSSIGFTLNANSSNLMDYRHNHDQFSLTRSQALNFLQRVYGKPEGQHEAPWEKIDRRGLTSGTQHFDEYEIFGSGQRTPKLIERPFDRRKLPTNIGGDLNSIGRFPFDFMSPLPKDRALFCPLSIPGNSLLGSCEELGYPDHNHMIAEGSAGEDWRFLLPGDIDQDTGLPKLNFNNQGSVNLFDASSARGPLDIAVIPITRGIFDAWSFTSTPPTDLKSWYENTTRHTAVVELSPGKPYYVTGEVGHFSMDIWSMPGAPGGLVRHWPRSIPSLLEEGTPHFVALGISNPEIGLFETDAWTINSPNAPAPTEVLP